eukprot:1194273-Prorocentrum_minimum.AAC.7
MGSGEDADYTDIDCRRPCDCLRLEPEDPSLTDATCLSWGLLPGPDRPGAFCMDFKFLLSEDLAGDCSESSPELAPPTPELRQLNQFARGAARTLCKHRSVASCYI